MLWALGRTTDTGRAGGLVLVMAEALWRTVL